MLELVKKAESKINFKSLDQKKKKTPIVREQKEIGVGASMIRKGLSQIKTTKHAPLVRYIHDDLPINFINEKKNRNISGYGVITPDHVIRIKSKWLFEKPFSIKNKEEWLRGFNKSLIKYKKDYEKYFQKYSDSDHIMLDSLPRLIFVENIGLFVVGFSEKELKINEDLALANIKTQLLGIYSGGFKPLNQRQLFEMEYWSLEQKKLGKKKAAEFSGKVVVVTGGAGVIGSKTAMQFHKNGAEVVVIDRNDQELDKLSCKVRLSNFVCDLTDKREVKDTLSKILMKYGGIDILVMNSGIAIEGAMESIDYKDIESSFENNFWAHQNIASETVTIMKEQGIKGCLLFNITKQVFNQGKNFGAYGISKSAMLSLMRQYAIELGEFGIRSNGVNPDKIRSNILTPEMIRKRSKSRKTTESNYMRGNLLSREVKAEDVAEAFLYLASAESTTGAVISVDGGNAFSFVR
jgi:NAD(P)-dependent dehydrogenase (short-subunit alcohol dehydrogenase family)